jgi:hypothetical protein
MKSGTGGGDLFRRFRDSWLGKGFAEEDWSIFACFEWMRKWRNTKFQNFSKLHSKFYGFAIKSRLKFYFSRRFLFFSKTSFEVPCVLTIDVNSITKRYTYSGYGRLIIYSITQNYTGFQ